MARRAVARGATALLIAALTATLLAATGSPAAAASVRFDAERAMVDAINQSRAAYGLPSLTMNLQMVRLGRTWARTMATENRVYHRPNLAEVVDGNFDRIADNVGYTALVGASDETLVQRLHTAFMKSSGHRAHILGSFNQVGVGIHRASGGRMWVTVNFLKGAIGGFPLYRDIDGSTHERAIGQLFLRGAIRGCAANRFCTTSTPSRAYVAAVIDRATATRSASYYVSSTCGLDWYCRNAEVTRRQLAMMVGSALDLEPAEGNQFTDIADTDQGQINAVVGAGLMSGCDSSRFCPGRTVTRAQMASVVNRAID